MITGHVACLLFRPLIDWDLILVMEPPTLFGALVGANLNKVLSETVVTVMLVILLTSMAYRTFKKALSMYRSETLSLHENFRQSNQPLLNPSLNYLDKDEIPRNNNDTGRFENLESGLRRPTSNTSCYNSGGNLQPIQLNTSDTISFYDSTTNHDIEECDSQTQALENSILLQNILDQERHVNTGNVTLIIVMFLTIVTLNILKGGGGYPSPIGISCGSITFWMAQSLLLWFIVMISLVARRRLIQTTNRKMDAGYKYLKEDVQWDERSTVVYFLYCSVAGCCAGM